MRLGVDIGGTFTDLVLLTADGTALYRKVLSTPPDFHTAVKDGIASTLSENGLSASEIGSLTHGTTVATNAIITRSGARTGLITTQGFRDVLEIRRMRMHKLYDITWEKPPPLVPRNLRLEISARTDPHTGEAAALDEDAVREVVRRLMSEGVESIAICYLHAYANGANERDTQALIKEIAPALFTSISSEVLPEIKEYERTSTTVINAYVQPVVDRYARAMQADLTSAGIDVPIMIMQSNGGMMPLELACEYPIHIVESGPAAGVTGVHHLARRMGIKDAMTLDIGGTTAKAAIIEAGAISRSPEYEVGGEISIGHRLMKGSGYLLRVPSIDLAEVGAGGGSIAWIDPAGALKVGPHSAGAQPGPACYAQGGDEPTITDANVYMRLSNSESLAGGGLKIHRHLAEQAIQDRIAQPLKLDLPTAAWGIRSIATSSLVRALRAVSTERGRDPQNYVLFAFGGMGPVHALDVATELGIAKVVVPVLPGLFSSLGLLFADVEHHFIQTYYADTGRLDHERLNGVLSALVGQAAATLEREGFTADHQAISLAADTRYEGQDYALSIPLHGHRLDEFGADRLHQDFHLEHDKTYGYRSEDETVQIVAVRCVARGLAENSLVPERLHVAPAKEMRSSAPATCYFGPAHGWIETDVVQRHDLTGSGLKGPAIVEEDSSSTVVLPGWEAALDAWSNIVLTKTG